MRIAAIGWLVVATGCNQIFGIGDHLYEPPVDATETDDAPGDASDNEDIDGDSIADSRDDCIAPAVEARDDEDADGIMNVEDLCPLDLEATANGDGDAVGDVCDVSSDDGTGKRRCFMALSSQSVNQQLWRDLRPTAPTWIAGLGSLTHVPSSEARGSSIFARRPIFLTKSVTVDADIRVETATAGAFRLWLHGFDEGSTGAGGVGCLLSVDASNTLSLRVVGNGPGNTVFVGTGANDRAIRVRGTFEPGVADQVVSCGAKVFGKPWVETQSLVALPAIPGSAGFGAAEWTVEVNALDIVEHGPD